MTASSQRFILKMCFRDMLYPPYDMLMRPEPHGCSLNFPAIVTNNLLVIMRVLLAA